MIKARTLVVAVALIAAGTLAADAQGYGWGPGSGRGQGWGWSQDGQGPGPGYGRGRGRGPGWRQAGGPCVTGQAGPCWRVQNPEKHSACWKEADSKGLRAQARRSFMTECMTK
ncbi:hypothetical protein PQJ75_23305 [Rhodoplanes sp. TEM]|uniref:Sulfur globule protein n=1 Tax=Rhodoplanes tepidamans TaxID=200616 RepID=A0ABT5JJ91_RHOTP|nr:MULTISPECIES: hypothetical protein [Rhodoplanes]MDC7789080.1 hypothetical protein [Rhodoplanes tepidamans]MDC7986667.1 hypothetical protein [Rhodoplanes sp. TEM]MDQ0354434.1 hypothetical protein [Rhodoplanes tepidamans]